jgi:hypothetical protein
MRAHRFRPRPLTRVGLHELDASIHAMVPYRCRGRSASGGPGCWAHARGRMCWT